MQHSDTPFNTQSSVELALKRTKVNVVGTKKIDIKGGNCAGISQRGLLDYLSNNFAFFKSRMVSLRRNYVRYKQLKVQPAEKKKFRRRQKIKWKQDKNVSFLRDIMIYQAPLAFRLFIGKSITQVRPVAISRLIASPSIKQLGGLHQVGFFLNFYNQLELIDLLKLIQKHVKKTKIAFSLSCNMHQIGIGFDGSTQQWILIEPNAFSDEPLSITELAKKIFAAFTFKTTFTDAAISFRCFTLGNHRRKNKQAIAALKKDTAFQQLQYVTPEKSLMSDDKKRRLFYFAAFEGCLAIMRILPNPPDKNSEEEKRAFFCAVRYNHLHVVHYMVQNNPTLLASVNFKYKSGLHIAAARNFSQLVDYFLKHGASPFIEDSHGHSPLAVAIAKDSKASLQLFLDHGVDLTKKDSAGRTPFEFARKANPSVENSLLPRQKNKRCLLFSKSRFASPQKRSRVEAASTSGLRPGSKTVQ